MKIRFFAQLQDLTHCEEIELAAPQPVDADGLWALLEEAFPGMSRYRDFTRLALNFEYAAASARFQDGDEVALIPPVSGG